MREALAESASPGKRTRAGGPVLLALAGVLSSVLGACSRPGTPIHVPPSPPLEIGTDSVDWEKLEYAPETVAIGDGYWERRPAIESPARALGRRHWVTVVGPKSTAETSPSGPVRGASAFSPKMASLYEPWLDASKEKPRLVIVLDRETNRLTSAPLPAGGALAAGPVTAHVEGGHARLAWADTSREPWRVGQARLDLATVTWTDLREADLPASAPDPAGASPVHMAVAFGGAVTVVKAVAPWPWSSGLDLDVWGAHGKEVVQLATMGDARIVARVFSSGTRTPTLELPAPPDVLIALERWRDPTPVRSEREICLLGGTANGRVVHAGLCFDMQARAYRAVKTLRPGKADTGCHQAHMPAPGAASLITCQESELDPHSDLPFPPYHHWEIVGMLTSADGE